VYEETAEDDTSHKAEESTEEEKSLTEVIDSTAKKTRVNNEKHDII
jgi:hypothetical protein